MSSNLAIEGTRYGKRPVIIFDPANNPNGLKPSNEKLKRLREIEARQLKPKGGDRWGRNRRPKNRGLFWQLPESVREEKIERLHQLEEEYIHERGTPMPLWRRALVIQGLICSYHWGFIGDEARIMTMRRNKVLAYITRVKRGFIPHLLKARTKQATHKAEVARKSFTW